MFEADDTLQFGMNPDLRILFQIPKTFKDEGEAFEHTWKWTDHMLCDPKLWMKVEKEDGAGKELNLLGEKFYLSKNYEQAEMFFLLALAREKYNSATYGHVLLNLAILRYVKGKYNQCIELLNLCEKTEDSKNFLQPYVVKIRAWKKLGDDQNAQKTFRRLKKLCAQNLSEYEKDKILREANQVLKELPSKKIKNEHDEELIVPEMEKTLRLRL